MNRPQHVTFTGLDDQTDLQRCQELSKRYPIEWGTLVGNKTGEHPRYPGVETLEKIVQRPFQKALHLCGDTAMFFQERPWEYSQATHFDRVQVNRKPSDYNLEKLRGFASQTPFRIIVQHREAAFPEDDTLDYLYDTSGGRGTIPETVPSYSGGNMVGYAGGINPDNVEEWVRRIDALVYWIDMESGVRTDDWLDLDKCEEVCKTIWGTYGHS